MREANPEASNTYYACDGLHRWWFIIGPGARRVSASEAAKDATTGGTAAPPSEWAADC